MQRITIRSRPKQSVKIRSHLIAPTDDVIIVAKTITENGFYNAKDENAKAYNPVRVKVPTFEEENAELTVENSQLKADIIVKNQQIAELEQGVGEAFENGKKAEYDRFWDSFQNNGSRTDYVYAFIGAGWNNETFNPKYPIRPTNATNMFERSGLTDFDFVESGVELDTSNTTHVTYMFKEAKGIIRLGVFDCRNCASINRPFYGCRIVTIDEFVVTENVKYDNAFAYCTGLKDIKVVGTIGQNGFNLSSAKELSRDSITSIINALSTTTSGLTVTLSKTAKEAAFSEEDWATLVATKPNWNIVLA